jgi:hypothetical protein
LSANRLDHQLWRYYPQMLELSDDVGASWFLDVFEAAPTPEKAARVRETTMALKEHRIRRFDAAHVLGELPKPALVVAAGTIETATGRIRGVIERLRLINSQLVEAQRQLDRFCKKLSEPVAGDGGEAAPGQRTERPDLVGAHACSGRKLRTIRSSWIGL